MIAAGLDRGLLRRGGRATPLEDVARPLAFVD